MQPPDTFLGSKYIKMVYFEGGEENEKGRKGAIRKGKKGTEGTGKTPPQNKCSVTALKA